MERNQFYNRDIFRLIKVQFTKGSPAYTYVSHKSLEIEKGDYVVVPTGNDEQVFEHGIAHETTKVVLVTAVTDDLRHIPKDYDLKHAVQKINPAFYNKVMDAKRK